ncbi:phosphonoacetate hydrolase [Pseudonocardia adelaidensis]|uniref:Phosphonoacetate hydrolase n=1 Tax=Pseudonocardia adelaidensis TaxID=648754 RepID=A0ABP9NAQ8_9PSEU
MSPRSFSANGRDYAASPDPVVVICIDGSEPDYHVEAMRAGRMPWLSSVLGDRLSSWPAHCAMPALTNPNNVSIATGRAPRFHGISGNYIYDVATGTEVLMNDKRFLRIPTLFAAANEAGLDVAVVTAKNKLRRLLGAGLVEDGPYPDGTAGRAPARRGICFSAEKADEATEAENGLGDVLEYVGLPLPSVYSQDLSEFVLAAGVRLLERRRPDLMYLSLTDYIQHKHAPGSEPANAFYAMVDGYAAALDALGAVVVITADHGMSPKSHPDGTPRVIFVEEETEQILAGVDTPIEGLRVILPITDPYTVHHGALGSFASVHLPDGADRDRVAAGLRALDGVAEVLDRAAAAERYELPADRIGDLVVLAEKTTALGRFAAWHDLGQLDAPLRSHGALGERDIPFFVNRALPAPDLVPGGSALVHNYDAFWVATTWLAQHRSEAAVTAATR